MLPVYEDGWIDPVVLDHDEVCAHAVRIIIAGGRDMRNGSLMEDRMDAIINGHKNRTICIIEGGARGADYQGRKYACNRGLTRHTEEANWDKYGRGAGYRRNAIQGTLATHLVAFWDGKSKGTRDMIDQGLRKGLETTVIFYESEEQDNERANKGYNKEDYI